MKKNKIISIHYINQLTDTKDEFWKDKSCGICSIQMLISFKKPEVVKVPVMELLDRCKEIGGYMENVGWRHDALVKLAKEYGVDADYQKVFYGREKTKEEGLRFIDKKLLKGEPVMASICFAFDPSKGGHLVIINGYEKEGKDITGYHILDPYPNKRGSEYMVSQDEFLRGWRGGLIWLTEEK
jgi:hypothetical protein